MIYIYRAERDSGNLETDIIVTAGVGVYFLDVGKDKTHTTVRADNSSRFVAAKGTKLRVYNV